MCEGVCELCDSTGPALSSNERGGPQWPLPAHEGSEAAETEQSFSGDGGKKNFDFRPRFLSEVGRHDNFKTSHRPVFKTEMFTPERDRRVVKLPWTRYGERRS